MSRTPITARSSPIRIAGSSSSTRPRPRQWVKAENAVSQPRLEALPYRAWVKQRLTALWNYERFGVPQKNGTHYFFMRNDGTQNQSVLYVSDEPGFQRHGAVRSRTPPAAMPPSRSSEFTPSPDGGVAGLRALRRRHGLADLEVPSRRRRVQISPDTLRREQVLGRLVGARWLGHLLQPVSAAPRGTAKGDDAGRPDIYFHKLGEPQEKDRARLQGQESSDAHAVSAHVTEDGRYLIISLYEGTVANGVDVLELGKPNAEARDAVRQVGCAVHLRRLEGR